MVDATTPARRLRDALEPVAMHAVWSKDVQQALGERGLDFLAAYVCGRAAPLGEVPSAVVSATFAVFEPGLIDTAWSARFALPELIGIRDRVAGASLRAVLAPVASEDEVVAVATVLEDAVAGLAVSGRALFGALRAQPRLADGYGRLWRATDLVREHRGDSHVAACVAAGLDPIGMNVLTETWVGYPIGEYSGTRAWAPELLEAAVTRLTADGLLADGRLTPAGQAFRDGIEVATDAAQRDLVDAVGPALDTVVGQLDTWSQRCLDADAFPADPRKRAAG